MNVTCFSQLIYDCEGENEGIKDAAACNPISLNSEICIRMPQHSGAQTDAQNTFAFPVPMPNYANDPGHVARTYW